MKKSGIYFLLIALVLMVTSTFAAELGDMNDDFATEPDAMSEDSLPTIFQNDEFYNANDELTNIKEITRPNCNAPELHSKILTTIKSTMQNKNNLSILERRKQALTLARLQEFTEVSAADFSPNDDTNVANALIMLKINQKINSDAILICKQTNTFQNPIYVVIFPYLDNFKGYIINLDGYINPDDVSFIYP